MARPRTTRLRSRSSKPARGSSNPDGESSKPRGGSSKPGDGSSKPDGESSKPRGGSSKPGDGSSKPDGGSSKPGDGSSKPGDGSSKPGDGSSKPGCGSSKPGCRSSKPGYGSSKGRAETRAQLLAARRTNTVCRPCLSSHNLARRSTEFHLSHRHNHFLRETLYKKTFQVLETRAVWYVFKVEPLQMQFLFSQMHRG